MVLKILGLGFTYALNYDLLAADHGIQPAQYPWYHEGLFNTLDHARYLLFFKKTFS